ncbi:HAMP domain-containing sensor histidine kinase [Oscillospiraceae bacterium MB08-C2-2]|nr:HAMP domain-containing sensor histidine kinase [Oscillospiraceae bacterium MB08-C2-2]
MFKRLRLRLTVVCALSTGLVLAGMAMASLYFSAEQLERQSDQTFQSNLNAIFFYLRSQQVIDHTWLGQTEADNRLYIRIESGENPLVYTGQNPVREFLTSLAQEKALREFQFDSRQPPSTTLAPDMVLFELSVPQGNYRAAVCSVPFGQKWLGVTVLKDKSPELAQARRLEIVFLLCVLVALACLAGFAWIFTGIAIRPIEEARRKQTEFVSAASHELRSPLAVIRASAETLPSVTADKVPYFSEKIEKECVRLSRLTGDLLQLAGADSQRWSVTLAPTNPETLVLSAVERFEELAAGKHIALSVKLPERSMPRISCDEQRILQLLTILLDNALCYTPEGGKILVSSCLSRRGIVFGVADSGPGIPPDQQEKIFERFYRGEASRTSKAHYGLGLSIAHEIALLHKGSLSVQESPLGGAQLVLRLPI